MQKQPYQPPELHQYQFSHVVGVSLPIGTSLPDNPLEALKEVNQ